MPLEIPQKKNRYNAQQGFEAGPAVAGRLTEALGEACWADRRAA
jgi:hypothetical protein